MNTEIEAKFLDVDHDVVRAKLQELGAVCEQPMHLMRRVTFDSPAMKKKGGWIRVRDEGHKVTLAYKQFQSRAIDATYEIESSIGDFDAVVAIFQQLELDGGSFQESKRETWKLGEAEIVLDEWPWLKPYIEVEATSAEVVEEVATKLGFDMKSAVYGDVMSAYYAQYPHLKEGDTIGDLERVCFGDPLPDALKGSK